MHSREECDFWGLHKNMNCAFPLRTESKLKTHSRKHIHGNTFEVLIYHLKIKLKSSESPIPLKAILKCKISKKTSTKAPLVLE